MSIMIESSQPGVPIGKRILLPLFSRLQQISGSGLSPRSLAKTVCIGAAIGLMPLVWGSSLLCILAGRWFRLNQLVLQAVNYLLYPVQLVLLVPFCSLGAQLLPGGRTTTPQQVGQLLNGTIGDIGMQLLQLSLQGMLVWVISVPPTAALVYRLIVTILVRNREQSSLST